MGGEGSISQMISTLKNNKLLSARRKNRIENVRDYFRDCVAKKREFSGKEVSKEELERIKSEIRIQAKSRAWRYYLIITFAIAIFIVGFILLIISL